MAVLVGTAEGQRRPPGVHHSRARSKARHGHLGAKFSERRPTNRRILACGRLGPRGLSSAAGGAPFSPRLSSHFGSGHLARKVFDLVEQRPRGAFEHHPDFVNVAQAGQLRAQSAGRRSIRWRIAIKR